MTDREKVIKGLECCQYSSKSHCDGCPYVYVNLCNTNDCTADLVIEALSMMKKQEATVKQWTKEIADYQLAHAPDSHDKGEKYQYKKGIWDGLQIAWNIISEGR